METISRSVVVSLACVLLVCCAEDSTTGFDGREITATQCQDGADNDGDGQTDCDDPDCQGLLHYLPWPVAEPCR